MKNACYEFANISEILDDFFFLILHQNMILKIMQSNIDIQIFQALYFTHEIESLSRNIEEWTDNIELFPLRGKLFKHRLCFCYNQIFSFSHELAENLYKRYTNFRDIVTRIVHKIVRYVLISKYGHDVRISKNQIIISIEIANLPLLDSHHRIDKIKQIGEISYVDGVIVGISDNFKTILRYFYICRECDIFFYFKDNLMRKCKKCGGLLIEDRTGDIATTNRIYFVKRNGSSTFYPIECVIECSTNRIYKIGSQIRVFGTLEYRCEKDYIKEYINVYSIKLLSECMYNYKFKSYHPEFVEFVEMLNDLAPNFDKADYRVILFLSIAFILKISILVIVQDYVTCDYISSVIETAFGPLVDTKASTFDSDIFEKSENIIILQNFQRYTNKKQQFVLDRVSKKDFKQTVACIAVWNENYIPESWNDFRLVVESTSKADTTLDYYLIYGIPDQGNCNLHKRLTSILSLVQSFSDDAIDLIEKYVNLTGHGLVYSISRAVATLRDSGSIITKFDVLISIYITEEKVSFTNESILDNITKPTQGFMFFDKHISTLRINDENTVFQAWVSNIEKVLNGRNDITNS